METVWKNIKFKLQQITKIFLCTVTCFYHSINDSIMYVKIHDGNMQETLASVYFQLFAHNFSDILVDSTTHMVGSYGPKNEELSYMTPVEEAPSGMLMRGAYK